MMNELVKLSAARQALAEAKSLQEIKDIKDIAVAAKAYVIAKGLGIEMKNEASEIEIRAIRELGRMIEQKQKDGELATQKEHGKGIQASVPEQNTRTTLPEIGVTRKESSTSKNLASIDDEQFEQAINKFVQNKKPLTKTAVLRDVAVVNTKTDLQIPDGTYRVIYADPPWKYSDTKQYRPDGAAENHYPVMSIQELCEMPLPKTEKNAVLFIWVTSPLLEDVFKVISAWGFKYKTSFVWDKVKHNMGHYNSVRHELLLIATKGSCLPDEKKLFDSVQSIERSNRHSEKPKEFYNIIETLYKDGRKCELFARQVRPGWEGYGNQLN